jgi:hypothetical protein
MTTTAAIAQTIARFLAEQKLEGNLIINFGFIVRA